MRANTGRPRTDRAQHAISRRRSKTGEQRDEHAGQSDHRNQHGNAEQASRGPTISTIRQVARADRGERFVGYSFT